MAAIFGCSGTALTADERAFFSDADPLGLILFQRNCENPDQVSSLTAEFRDLMGRDAPVLIDQEGGRVARLKPPHWPKFPPARAYGDLYVKNAEQGLEAAHLGAHLIAQELSQLGVTIDCAPVLDIPSDDADPIIGDRAFGLDADTVTHVARAFMEGLMAGGVAPVIKHIPGHGRANVDSHKALPVVDASAEELSATDFKPFHDLNVAHWAMTAHVVYTALDRQAPATLSAHVISGVIRKQLGFQGVLLSDDLSMEALSGTLEERARAALAAGCDIALHCNGKLDEMQAVAAGASLMTRTAWPRYKLAELHRHGALRDFDAPAARARFSDLMEA